jgi:two-component system, OmpR family, sensor histidine kinase BaeS
MILAFLLVSITGVALASGITYWQTSREFSKFSSNSAQDRFVEDMTFYYQQNGKWDGVLDYYQMRNSVTSPGNPQQNFQPPQPGGGGGQPPNTANNFVLVDMNSLVVIPAGNFKIGDSVPQENLSKGTKIEVDGNQVGTVLTSNNMSPFTNLETQYLTRTTNSLLFAALGASAVALLLGIILAGALTHPLRDLTTAIRAMAGGNLKQHVQVKSKDELGELANAFNQMSADLDSLNQSRRQMTADIAHDLRTPLTVISGYAESMRDGVLKPTPERFDAIHIEIQHLQRLVEDLRTLSQADAKELSLNPEPVSPAAILERMAQAYRPLATMQDVKLKTDVEPGLPDLLADPDRMAQVFGNLISNSLHYTHKGGEILLFACREEKTLIMGVRDTGSGIAPDLLPYIFERFRRGDSSRQDGGSGLGLAIAKAIVELHGGTISAENNVDKGATIKIKFPL